MWCFEEALDRRTKLRGVCGVSNNRSLSIFGGEDNLGGDDTEKNSLSRFMGFMCRENLSGLEGLKSKSPSLQ